MSGVRCLFKASRYLPNGRICRISTTARKDLFFEGDAKSGYGKKFKFSKASVIDGFHELKKEFGVFKSELRELWESDPMIACPPGYENKIWKFETPQELDQWVTTSDSDHSQGFSKCKFTLNPSGHALFSGTLSTDVPKDGQIKRAGYCAIRTLRASKSFKRDSYWDWTGFSHLVIRCRGDGRSYMLNLYTMGYYDQLWNDVYHYPLYTRGGPYWQTTRIPFSKFFFASKGTIQDLQSPISLDSISHFGITASDRYSGNFQLEIDYIATTFDPSTQYETFAYEHYKLPKGIAST
ncbi:complex I intermediate-associated protein [Nesidiocoris tenuis]|uniref:Complex I intermediate-associated protein n=1 Tax=Nesidiocoris tenuis TaxID=355587 RepID=A0ABN7A9H5_9HEMI|nr:complex I intermediate-associated protein [Nesidiocoris tenuis]